MDRPGDDRQGQTVPNEAEQSLWEALHDAHLDRLASDALARTVTLTLDMAHLRQFAGLPDATRWRLAVCDASKLLARRWDSWPGPSPDTQGLPRAAEADLVAAYQAKGRIVSVDWAEFECTVSSKGLWVSDGTLHHSATGTVLRAWGHDSSEDRFFEFEIVGGRLEWERSDGQRASTDELLRLGHDYWAEFEARGLTTG